jgi:hypothetical protein
MAANQAGFNNYLQNVLQIESLETRQAINSQGITAFDDLTHRNDKYVQEIFTKIRNPGGLIPNPAFVAQPPQAEGAAAAPFVPAMIPNRGVSVGVNIEFRVRQLRYFLFHMHRIQRPFGAAPFGPAFATIARLERLWALNERIERMKGEQKDLPTLDVLVKVDNVRKSVEDIEDLLGKRLGAYGSPLSYLIREDVVPDDATDPGFGEPNAMAEMVRRTRHDGDQYEEDNMTLWNVVRQVTHGGPAWNWVKGYSATKNGRDAFFALKNHYMGRSFQKRNISQAETTLATSYYDGKSRNFTFEDYCRALNMAFLDLEEAGEGLTEERKVRILLENIRAPELLMSVERVQGDPQYESSFEQAMYYLADQVNKKKHLAAKARGSTRNISAVTNEGRSGKAKGGKGKGKNGKNGHEKAKSNYIPWKKWSKMTKEQQEAHRQKKQAEQNSSKRSVAAVETADDDDEDANESSAGTRMSRRN